MDGGSLSVQEFLGRLPFFEGLSSTGMKMITRSVTQRFFQKGALVQDIIEKGAPREGFHVVVNGTVKLLCVAHNGGEKVIRALGPGDSFGEENLFVDRIDTLVTTQATSPAFLLHVSRESVLAVLQREPAFAMRMLSHISSRVYSLLQDIEDYTLKSATQRVVDYFLKNAVHEAGNQYRFTTNKSLIASLLNITPEHFSRILRELCAQQLILIEGREVTIPDPERLRIYDS